MIQNEQLVEQARSLRLYNLSGMIDEVLRHAQESKPTYPEFLDSIFSMEISAREKKDYERRMALARLPVRHDLNDYDFDFSDDIGRQEMKELRELVWMRQAYNIMLIGPSGTGKTYVASGLVFDAVKAGYRAYVMTMEGVLTCLKMKEISTAAMMTYKRMLRAHLLVIDDIMLFPVNKEDAIAFFNLVNLLHEQTSIIITTNKVPTEWAVALNDEVLASALLDRLLFHCEVIKLTGNSYRMENRLTIFKDVTSEKREDIGEG